MAESTGKFPPTPTLHNAAKTPIAAKSGEPAAMRPKTDVMPIVRLKAQRRPNMSPAHISASLVEMIGLVHPKPQNIAPTSNPMFCERESRGGFVGENSFVIGVRINEVTIGQRLSLAQPKPPTTMNSCHWYLPIPISCIAVFRTRALPS